MKYKHSLSSLFLLIIVLSSLLSACNPSEVEYVISESAHIWGNANGTQFQGMLERGIYGTYWGEVGRTASGMYARFYKIPNDVAVRNWKSLVEQGWIAVNWRSIPEPLKVFFMESVISPMLVTNPGLLMLFIAPVVPPPTFNTGEIILS